MKSVLIKRAPSLFYLSYFLKKNLRKYQQISPLLAYNKLALKPTSLGTKNIFFLFKANMFSLLGRLRKNTNKTNISNGFSGSYKNLLKTTCLLYGQGTPRYERLYLFLKQATVLKKQKSELLLKKAAGLLRVATLNSTQFSFKGLPGQAVSQNLQLYQTLNDYFFSPSFYFNINKGSR